MVHRLRVRREEAERAERVEVLPPAARRDVDRARPRSDDLIGPQRQRALVVVLVSHEHHVHGVGVEERYQVGPDGQAAAVHGAARVDGVVEDDELPRRRARREVVLEEHVLRATRRRALVRVDHHDVCIADVERVVVLAPVGVVGGRVEGVPPGLAGGGRKVVVAEARPEDELPDQVRVGREERWVEVGGLTARIDHVAGVDDHVGGGGEQAVADGGLARAGHAGVAEHEHREGCARVVSVEHRLRAERDAVGVRDVGVSAARDEPVDRNGAHRAGVAGDGRRRAVERANRERARARDVGVPDHGHRVRGEELQVRPTCEHRRARRRRCEQGSEHCRAKRRRALRRDAARAGGSPWHATSFLAYPRPWPSGPASAFQGTCQIYRECCAPHGDQALRKAEAWRRPPSASRKTSTSVESLG